MFAATQPLDRDPSPPTVVCPVCGSRRLGDYRLVGTARSWLTGARFRVLRCREHGVELADAPAPARDAASIARSMGARHGRTAAERARAGRFLDGVESVVAGRGTLHDVGCGVGALLAAAAERGWDVQGSDINPVLVERVRKAGHRCSAGTLPQLGLAPESCDVVTSYCVLPNHVAEPNAELAAAYTALRPGGWLVLELPTNGIYRRTAKALHRLSGRRWSWVLSHFYMPGKHPLAYDAGSITAHLASAGFVDVAVRPFRHSPYYTTGRFRAMPWWKRIPLLGAVQAAHGLSYVPGLANHMLVFARRPAQTQ